MPIVVTLRANRPDAVSIIGALVRLWGAAEWATVRRSIWLAELSPVSMRPSCILYRPYELPEK